MSVLNPAGEHVVPPPPAMMNTLHAALGIGPDFVPSVPADDPWSDMTPAEFVERACWSALDFALYEALRLAKHPSAGRHLGRAPFEAVADFVSARADQIVAIAAAEVVGEPWIAAAAIALGEDRRAAVRAGALAAVVTLHAEG